MKLIPKLLVKKNGKKNIRETGTPITILFAKSIVFSKFLCSL